MYVNVSNVKALSERVSPIKSYLSDYHFSFVTNGHSSTWWLGPHFPPKSSTSIHTRHTRLFYYYESAIKRLIWIIWIILLPTYLHRSLEGNSSSMDNPSRRYILDIIASLTAVNAYGECPPRFLIRTRVLLFFSSARDSLRSLVPLIRARNYHLNSTYTFCSPGELTRARKARRWSAAPFLSRIETRFTTSWLLLQYVHTGSLYFILYQWCANRGVAKRKFLRVAKFNLLRWQLVRGP